MLTACPCWWINAHGAYLRFLPGGSRHPIDLGAAACCDSGHKTLPVLTGGAYLHLAPKAPVQEESTVRSALALFGSTSRLHLDPAVSRCLQPAAFRRLPGTPAGML